MVPKGRIELPTRRFSVCRSTTELLRHIGAGRESRTPVVSLATRYSTIELCPHVGEEGRTRTCEGAMPAVLRTAPFATRVTSTYWLRRADLNDRWQLMRLHRGLI